MVGDCCCIDIVCDKNKLDYKYIDKKAEREHGAEEENGAKRREIMAKRLCFV